MKLVEILRKVPLFPYIRGYYDIYKRGGFIKVFKTRIISSKEKDIIEGKVEQLEKVCEIAKIDFRSNERFFYSIDTNLHVLGYPGYRRLGNLTVDYSFILERGLEGIEKIIDDKLKKEDNRYLKFLKRCVDAIKVYWRRCVEYSEELADILARVPVKPARNLEEALQSILFINSLLWMYGHPLNGLGRLDKILEPYYTKAENTHEIIKNFILALSKYYEFKSNVLPGDTGQVIVLGGEYNKLTQIFLEVMRELRLPDPKIVLRVNRNMPEKIWELSYECLKEGLGYPLFSNDEVIIKSLGEYYDESDAVDYSTSACWEPLIPGKSADQNNLANINLLKPLEDALRGFNGGFEELLERYRKSLNNHLDETIDTIESLKVEPSPLLSLFFPDCLKNAKDIAYGGTRYNINGILTVGMGNLINSLLNIKRVCYDQKRIKPQEIISILEDNFRSHKSLKFELENKGLKYGMDEPEVIELTNRIISMLHEKLRGKYKFGLSSPSYLTEGESTKASFDGRLAREPLGVNISPVKFTANMSYTEIFNFASELDYSKAYNGGVVDIMIEKSLMDRIPQEFTSLIKTAIMKGVMQIQVNVLNPKILLKALKNPELFPDLIVRVWGFSTYFKDLPKEYQEIIVKRALEYSKYGD
ncbi:MAG: DUF3029 family protein [Methanobacteriaceae archaeon]|nr:DUF3029 family protein [Methanobacteriaceae archaeon]